MIGWNSLVGQWCRIEGTTENITILGLLILYDIIICIVLDTYVKDITLGEGVKTKPEIIVRNSVVLPHKELSGNHNEEILL